MLSPHYQLQEKYDPHWDMPRFHFHEHCELFLPIASQGTLFVREDSFPFDENTLFFLGANSLHRSVAHSAHHRFVLHLSQDTFQTFSTFQTDFSKLSRCAVEKTTLSPEALTETHRLFQHLLQQCNDGCFGSDLRQTTALLDLLIYITPFFPLAQTDTPENNKDMQKDMRKIAPILDYIQENLAEPLNLDQISAHFYLSKHYLCRIFKSTTGFSVMEYIIHYRIAKARHLLQQGYSVQRAGELSGFSDNSHFIRTFGKLNGISPGKYTKQYKQSDLVPPQT